MERFFCVGEFSAGVVGKLRQGFTLQVPLGSTRRHTLVARAAPNARDMRGERGAT